VIEKYALCWDGNPDALIYGGTLYLTRAIDIVSLRLFYNFGRLWWECSYGTGGDERGRLVNRQLHHDREWVITEQGRHCKLCGKPLRDVNPRLRKFCPHCEREFFNRYVQYDCWSWFRERVKERDKNHCVRCGVDLGYTWVCDHIVPLVKGGKDWLEDPEMSNFQSLCEECNKEKTALDFAKPKVVKEKRNVQKIEYRGWVFEKVKVNDYPLAKFMER
jgi:hypothetical protein